MLTVISSIAAAVDASSLVVLVTGLDPAIYADGLGTVLPTLAHDHQVVIAMAERFGSRDQPYRTGQLFSIGVDGKRGKQALSVVVLEQPASVVKAGRKPAEDVAVILEDLIKLMDSASNQLRRGRYPSDDHCRKLAAVMRAVADDFDV